MARVGIYARRSPRPTESETLARQLDDCRALAAELGWEVIDEYVDKDQSAYARKPRPEFDRMLEDIESDRIDAVLAAHVNRLYRHTKELATFVELVQKHRTDVRTVMAGHYDLSTAAGRKHAFQAGLDAMYEAELLGERVTRERKARAHDGKPGVGGLRPFGYEADKVTLHPVESRLIREAAERVAAGGSLYAETLAWNEAGVTTTAGNPWEVSAVRRVLVSPRIAGLRVYKPKGAKKAREFDAAWPAIIDRETHDRLKAMVQGRRRGQRARPKWLLSGLIECPKCGRAMYGSSSKTRGAYVCAPSPGTGRGCGGASISAPAADGRVSEVLDAWFADPPALLRPSEAGPDTSAELRAIDDSRRSIVRQFAAGRLPEDEFEEAMGSLDTRRRQIEETAAAPVVRPVLDLEDAWRRGSVENRRAVIEALVQTPIPLAPGVNGGDPADRLSIVARS